MFDKLLKDTNSRFAALIVFFGVAICVVIARTETTPDSAPFEWTSWQNDGTMGIIAGITALTLLILVALRRFKPSVFSPANARRFAMVVGAFMILAATVYFYTNRGWTKRHYTKYWDSYHYLVGAKYFPELGYNDFYRCHIKADRERSRPRFRARDRVRDLETYRVMRVRDIEREIDCSAFTPERWQEFRHDLDLFDRHNSRRAIGDHGYNGAPFAAAVAGRIASVPELSYERLVHLAFIDILGLCLMMGVIIWAFGWEVGVLFVLFFATNFADRFHYIGASYFRYMWMVTLGMGLAFLWKKRYGVAAVFMVIAAMLNVFPLLYFVGIVVKAVSQLIRERRLAQRYQDFIKWGLIASVVCGAISVSHERPVETYREFFSVMSMHSRLLTTSRIGFRYNFLYRGEIDEESPQVSYTEKGEALDRIAIPYNILVALILIFGLALILRLDDLKATVFGGFLLFFMLFSTVEYYYASSAIIVLFWAGEMKRKGAWAFLALLFGMMALVYVVWNETRFIKLANNHMMSALFTVYLGSLMLYLSTKRTSSKTTSPSRRSYASLSPLMTVIMATCVVLGLSIVAVDGRRPLSLSAAPQGSREPRHTLLATGDSILARRMHYALYDHGRERSLRDLRPLISSADIAMTNLETVIAWGGDLFPKGGYSPYYFRGRPELLDLLAWAGFDVVMAGNNHSMDYGPEALAQQSKILAESRIASVGAGRNLAEAQRPLYIRAHGVTVAVVSVYVGGGRMGAETHRAGVFQVDREAEVFEAVRGVYEEARRHADLVVFSPHWGANMIDRPPQERVRLAHRLIDLGFDAILGHSAHVLQGVEVYEGRPIVYDMGNLLSDWVANGMERSAAFILEFDRSGFHRLRLVPLRISGARARLATGRRGEETRRHIVRLSRVVDRDIQFGRHGEELFVSLNPPRREPRQLRPPPRVHETGSTRLVPERFTSRRSPTELDEPPAYATGFTPIKLQKGVDIIGARAVEVVATGSCFVVEVALKARGRLKGSWEAMIIAQRRESDDEFLYPHPISNGATDPRSWPTDKVIVDRICVRPQGKVHGGIHDLSWTLRSREDRSKMLLPLSEEGTPLDTPARIGSVKFLDSGVSSAASGVDWDGRAPSP